MFVIKEMRLNKFQPRPIVSNRELALANGNHPATIVSKETSDCYNEPSIEGASKTKVLGLAQEISSKAIEFAKNAEQTDPLKKSQANL